MNLQQIKQVHQAVVKMEMNQKAATLVIQYIRGCTYIAAHQHFETASLYKEWILKNFEISTSTARRYIWLANLLKTFPRLIVTGINMSILTKHEKRIRETFKDVVSLAADITIINHRGDVICKITESSMQNTVGRMRVIVESPFGDSQIYNPSLESRVCSL